MIWSGTTHVGMGLAVSSSGTTYVVARYSPPGNYVGQSPAQGANSGSVQKPTHGKRQRPGQRHSGSARKPTNGRQQWPGQRDSSPTHHGNHGGMQPPFYGPGYVGMQSPSPYQPFPPPGSSWNGLPGSYSPPLPQSGILGPHEFNRWMTDPNLRYSPYNPLGPLVNPGIHRASDTRSASTGCCIIL